MKQIRIAIIGIGYWGKNYIRVLTELNTYFELIGVIDLNQLLIQKYKILYPNILFTNDINEIINLVDAFIIATPVSTHYKLAKLCIKNGKHLLVEKPLTLSSQKSNILYNLAQKYYTVLLTGFTVLYTEGFKYLCDFLKNNKSTIYYFNFIRTN